MTQAPTDAPHTSGHRSTGAPPAVEVRGLVKQYGSVKVVDDVSFAVPSGSVFAFLGTNGAGKSTTIGCLTTTVPLDRGAVRVAGADVARESERVRRAIGVVFQDSLLDGASSRRRCSSRPSARCASADE